MFPEASQLSRCLPSAPVDSLSPISAQTGRNSRRISIYGNRAANSLRIRTYKIADTKSRRMNTYEKRREGEGTDYCFVPGTYAERVACVAGVWGVCHNAGSPRDTLTC